jgi:hypothetical protein
MPPSSGNLVITGSPKVVVPERLSRLANVSNSSHHLTPVKVFYSSRSSHGKARSPALLTPSKHAKLDRRFPPLSSALPHLSRTLDISSPCHCPDQKGNPSHYHTHTGRPDIEHTRLDDARHGCPSYSRFRRGTATITFSVELSTSPSRRRRWLRITISLRIWAVQYQLSCLTAVQSVYTCLVVLLLPLSSLCPNFR